MIQLIKEDRCFQLDVNNDFGFNEMHNLYYARTKNGYIGYVDVFKKGESVDFVAFGKDKKYVVLIDNIDLIITNESQRKTFINKSKIIDYSPSI